MLESLQGSGPEFWGYIVEGVPEHPDAAGLTDDTQMCLHLRGVGPTRLVVIRQGEILHCEGY